MSRLKVCSCFVSKLSPGSGHAIKIKGDTQGLSRFISLGCHKFGGTVIYLLFLFYFDTEGFHKLGDNSFVCLLFEKFQEIETDRQKVGMVERNGGSFAT